MTVRDVQARLRRQDGSTPVAFLICFPVVLACAVMIVQIFLIFTNALLVNNALSATAQEAAARGGVDGNVQCLFNKQVPSYLEISAADTTFASVPAAVGAPCDGTRIRQGGEGTTDHQVITLTYTYQQPLPMLDVFTPGPPPVVAMSRQVKIASQSAKE